MTALTRDQIVWLWIRRDCMDAIQSGDMIAQVVVFARAVATAERERCALLCESRSANGNYEHDTRHECVLGRPDAAA